jgi:DNA-binding PadR family transcriptional regulator
MRTRRAPADDGRQFLPLSPQVFQILLSLHQSPQHGYAIIQDVLERTAGEIRLTASTLYDALARLVDHQLIEEAETPTDAAGQDSRRRYYQLTPLGRRTSKLEVDRLERLLRTAREAGAIRRGTPGSRGL